MNKSQLKFKSKNRIMEFITGLICLFVIWEIVWIKIKTETLLFMLNPCHI